MASTEHLFEPSADTPEREAIRDGVRAEDIDVDGRAGGEGSSAAAHGLHHDRRFGDPQTRAAVFRRHGDAQPTAFGDGLAEFKGEFA